MIKKHGLYSINLNSLILFSTYGVYFYFFRTYVKILECCKYFTNDSKSEENNQNLTLLTANSSSSEKVTLVDEDEVEGIYDKIYLADLVGKYFFTFS